MDRAGAMGKPEEKDAGQDSQSRCNSLKGDRGLPIVNGALASWDCLDVLLWPQSFYART